MYCVMIETQTGMRLLSYYYLDTHTTVQISAFQKSLQLATEITDIGR